jgi:hypothetical protein
MTVCVGDSTRTVPLPASASPDNILCDGDNALHMHHTKVLILKSQAGLL